MRWDAHLLSRCRLIDRAEVRYGRQLLLVGPPGAVDERRPGQDQRQPGEGGRAGAFAEYERARELCETGMNNVRIVPNAGVAGASAQGRSLICVMSASSGAATSGGTRMAAGISLPSALACDGW